MLRHTLLVYCRYNTYVISLNNLTQLSMLINDENQSSAWSNNLLKVTQNSVTAFLLSILYVLNVPIHILHHLQKCHPGHLEKRNKIMLL